MTKVRVLVVEDSLTARQRLCEILSAHPDIELVGQAENGKRGIELCQKHRPDVVTLDMMMPLMSGLAATEYIMAYCPTPILIVSASVNRGELFRTYDALAAGAVDVLEKPRGDDLHTDWEQKFIATIKLIARIKVITHPGARLRLLNPVPEVRLAAIPTDAAQRCRLVAIGASTGGPSALVTVLQTIPQGFALPILFVLHIDEPFGSAFAEWLDAQTPHPVAYAREGEAVAGLGGRIVMAPPGRHLTLHAGRLRLSDEPERHSCRPSVDVLFEAVAREYGAGATACLLTGMGRDGAAGMLAIKQAGGRTIAQDEATSTVYGMPREAILLGGAEHVLPLSEIGGMIAQLAGAIDS